MPYRVIAHKPAYLPVNANTDDAPAPSEAHWTDEWMNSNDMVFVIVFATLWAWMEVEMEGKHGWAVNLPTSCAFLGWTWYHISMNLIVLVVLYRALRYHHFPTLQSKLSIFALYVIAWFVIEDLMWFILNRNYGIAKYNVEDVPWHAKKPWFAGTFVYNWIVFLAWILATLIEQNTWNTSHIFRELCIGSTFLLLAIGLSALNPDYYNEPSVSNTGCYAK